MYACAAKLADIEGVLTAPPVMSWSVMFGAYTRNRDARAVFGLLRDMQIKEDDIMSADEIIVLIVLPACSRPTELARLRLLHAFIVLRGLDAVSDKVPNVLVAAYRRCGRVLHTECIFADIRRKMVSSWNTLIGAHAQQNTRECASMRGRTSAHVGEASSSKVVTGKRRTGRLANGRDATQSGRAAANGEAERRDQQGRRERRGMGELRQQLLISGRGTEHGELR
ncbi:hypothetical protein ZWY2020_026881 [Hordeum vulgare]|nr:hypothetical protein ZWY2020_026881 [Hordeum vulgare]